MGRKRKLKTIQGGIALRMARQSKLRGTHESLSPVIHDL